MIMIMILKHLPVISIVGWLSPLGVIHNDLHPPKKPNMALKITKVKKETQIWTRPPIFCFQMLVFRGESTMNQPMGNAQCAWMKASRGIEAPELLQESPSNDGCQ